MSQPILYGYSKRDLELIIEKVARRLLKTEIIQEKDSKSSLDDKLSQKEAATFLGISITTLIKYKKEGLPYYQVGKNIFFSKNELLEFSRKNRKL